MAGSVKWYGNEVVAEIGKIKKSALRKVGRMVSRDAKNLCPVGIETRGTQKKGQSKGQTWTERMPGSLKKSIRYRVTKKGSVQVLAGNRDVYYARFVEFGTSKTIAQPFLRPALHKNQNAIVEVFEGQLKK